MTPPGVVEPVDVLKYGSFSLPSCCPFLPPDQLRFEAFEERFDRSVIIAIALAAHRRTQAMGLQLLLIIIRAVLAAAIGMEKAAIQWLAEAHRHIERPDREILLHPVASRPPEPVEGQRYGGYRDQE
jgi:hypothetical protein